MLYLGNEKKICSIDEHHASGFRLPIDGPRSHIKYLVCDKEAARDNTNEREHTFVSKNSSTQAGSEVPEFFGIFLAQSLPS